MKTVLKIALELSDRFIINDDFYATLRVVDDTVRLKFSKQAHYPISSSLTQIHLTNQIKNYLNPNRNC